MIQDATVEAVSVIYRDNPRGVTLYRDELSGWFGNHGRYSNGTDIRTWLESYNGGPHRSIVKVPANPS